MLTRLQGRCYCQQGPDLSKTVHTLGVYYISVDLYKVAEAFASQLSARHTYLPGNQFSVVWSHKIFGLTNRFTIKFALDVLKDDLSSYYGTPFVSASFGTDPLRGVLTASNGDVLDARMRFHNYNVANAETSSTSFLPSAVLNWQPTPNLSISDEGYDFHARRSYWTNTLWCWPRDSLCNEARMPAAIHSSAFRINGVSS
jgi:hypothetical protein